jgi:hypothetical protein
MWVNRTDCGSRRNPAWHPDVHLVQPRIQEPFQKHAFCHPAPIDAENHATGGQSGK